MTESSDTPPRQIGPFEVRWLLGRGGMGEVWLAHDPMLARKVAIKVLPQARTLDPRAEERLIREARAASALDHPGIVTVHQLGRDRGRLFIAMEFVSGSSLADVVAKGPLPPVQVAEIVVMLADALNAAHRAELIHRDIKPDNIVLRDDGQPKILDFGLVHAAYAGAAAADADADATAPTVPEAIEWPGPDGRPSPDDASAMPPSGANATRSDPFDETLPAGRSAVLSATQRFGGPAHTAVAGTPLYMAPEQVAGREPTPASDQFALALTAYELLSGVPLRSGNSISEVLATPLHAALEAAAGHALPPASVRVLARALEQDPQQRHGSITEFAEALRAALLPAQPTALPGTATAPSRTRAAPRRLWLALIATALLASLAAVALLAWQRREPSELTMVVVPGNVALFTHKYAPVAAFFGNRIDKPVQVQVAANYAAAIDAIVSGKAQLAFLPPRAYIEASERVPELQLIGARDYHGSLRYRAYIVASSRDGVAPTLESLRGGVLCYVDPKSTSGYVMARSLLRRKGIEPATHFGEIRFVGGHYRVLRALKRGQCAAGAVSSLDYADAPRQAITTDDLPIIAQSEVLPPVAIVAHPLLSGATVQRLRAAVLEAREASPMLQAELQITEEVGRFGPVRDEVYDDMRAMLKEAP